jgi:hypothetical protein
VEATPEQLEATLADMAAQPKDFLSVDVGAAEARGVQTRWQEQYSRGRGGMSQQRFLSLPPVPDAAKQLAPSAPATDPARPASPKLAANEPQPDDGLAAIRQQSASRARAYAMPAEGAGSPAQNFNAQEPGTLRALFVLRVTDEPTPAKKK